jgi:hypothetical protein
MRSVEMCLQPSELPGVMAEMRMWLDERRFEPSVFSCHDESAGVVVRVDFKITAEAEAFACRFKGRIGGPQGGRGQPGWRVPHLLVQPPRRTAGYTG